MGIGQHVFALLLGGAKGRPGLPVDPQTVKTEGSPKAFRKQGNVGW
jgi:hypothetical protein